MVRAARILLAGAVLSLSILGSASAEGKTGVSAAGNINVSPAVQQVVLTPGQASASLNAQVTNNDQSPIVVQVLMNDFTSLNNTGSVSFLSGNAGGGKLHGLAQWMHVNTPYVTVGPHATQTVPVTISDTATLAPGGHYGAVIFRVIPTAGIRSGGQLTTNEEVSMLVFLTTNSGRTQALTLHTPEFNSIFMSMPNAVNLVFTNSGNTQTTPFGLVTVADSKHNEIARGVVNVDSGLVLPATDRLYDVNLKYNKAVHFPGKYRLTVSYRAGSGQPALTYTKTFFYINRPIVVVVLVAALAGILLFFRRTSRAYGRYKAQT